MFKWVRSAWIFCSLQFDKPRFLRMTLVLGIVRLTFMWTHRCFSTCSDFQYFPPTFEYGRKMIHSKRWKRKFSHFCQLTISDLNACPALSFFFTVECDGNSKNFQNVQSLEFLRKKFRFSKTCLSSINVEVFVKSWTARKEMSPLFKAPFVELSNIRRKIALSLRFDSWFT